MMTRLAKRHDGRLVTIAPSESNGLDSQAITGIYLHSARQISFGFRRPGEPDAVFMRDEWELVHLWSDSMKNSWLTTRQATATTRRPYYTLLIRQFSNDPWQIHFGDYERACVVDESAEVAYDLHCQTKIIKTSDAQTDIDAEVARLNFQEEVKPCDDGYGPDQEWPPGAPIYK